VAVGEPGSLVGTRPSEDVVHDAELESRKTDDLRAGVRISSASFAWTFVSSAVAVALGVESGSLVLVAFGLTGLLDAGGSATLIVHFRHALRHESYSERHEQVALRVVTFGLVVVGSVTLVESVRRLVLREHGQSTLAGIVLAAVSIVVLAALAHRKRTAATRIPSRALLADAGLSMIGCLLAVVTVVGTALAGIGWWWADPVAAAAVAGGTLTIAAVVSRT
jgi:divalent metal cation (Fe/Co/Zn/Cd) transporter